MTKLGDGLHLKANGLENGFVSFERLQSGNIMGSVSVTIPGGVTENGRDVIS